MDSKLKSIMLFVLLGLSCFISGCQCLEQKVNSWIYDATLDEFFMDSDSLKVKKIIICTPDDNDSDDWTPLFEISEPEKIRKVVEVLRTAVRGFMPAWSERMKIITENKKFIMKFDCDDETAYGTYWDSKEFRELLRQWGFPNPK